MVRIPGFPPGNPCSIAIPGQRTKPSLSGPQDCSVPPLQDHFQSRDWQAYPERDQTAHSLGSAIHVVSVTTTPAAGAQTELKTRTWTRTPCAYVPKTWCSQSCLQAGPGSRATVCRPCSGGSCTIRLLIFSHLSPMVPHGTDHETLRAKRARQLSSGTRGRGDRRRPRFIKHMCQPPYSAFHI